MRWSLAVATVTTGILTSCGGYQELASEKEAWNSDVMSTTYRHKYGVEVSKSDWETRGCDGQVITRMKDGVTITKSFAAAVQEGETTYTFPHSTTIEKVESYVKGRLAKEVKNYSSGLPREEREHLLSGSTVVTVWYESGTPMSVEEMKGERLLTGRYYRRDERLDGEVAEGAGQRKLRDPYGQLISVDDITDGLMVTKTTFHPTGTPKEVIPYVAGKIEGTKRSFLPGGEPKTAEKWVGGVQQGTTITYRNGEKYSEIPFENGTRKGIERRYRNGEQLEEEVTWAADERHGPTRVFVGDKVKTDWYYQGKLVSKVVFEQMSHV